MKLKFKEEQIHFLFKIGVALKGIDGALETLAGFALLFTPRPALNHLINWLTQGELQEDPDDFVASHLVDFFHHLSLNTKHFAAIYFLIHGLVKMALAAGLLRGKIKAYPAALIILGFFLGYQIYRFSHTRSVGLGLITLLDICILFLIWRDYKYLKARRRRTL